MLYEKKLSILLVMRLAASLGKGCKSLGSSVASDVGQEEAENTADAEETDQSVSSEAQTDEDMFTDRDYGEDYQEDCVSITLSGTYTAVDDSSIDAVIYSKQDLTFNGTGALTISSPGGQGPGQRGGAGMAQTFSESDQGVVSVNAGNQAAGTEVSLADSSGDILLSVTPELSFSVVILSSPQLVPGENYTLTVGTVSEEAEAD